MKNITVHEKELIRKYLKYLKDEIDHETRVGDIEDLTVDDFIFSIDSKLSTSEVKDKALSSCGAKKTGPWCYNCPNKIGCKILEDRKPY